MKAMILAAGLGTRLKPWTLHHPKALVPVGGVPMLERVICSLKSQGFNRIIINIHHFGNQIIDFLRQNDFGVEILVSDERDELLDTGGGVLHASEYLCGDNEPFLIHNVDILSNADLSKLMCHHKYSGNDATLLVSRRNSTRKLIVGEDVELKGWHNMMTDEYRPADFVPNPADCEYAFSGIHVMSVEMLQAMSDSGFQGSFSVMDFYIKNANKYNFGCKLSENLELIDIGKPETLERANELFR